MKIQHKPSVYDWLGAISGERHLLVALAMLLVLTGSGTLGFIAIEGMRFSDAAYLTVITLSTVGYGDFVPLSAAGRWFSMALIALGLGAVFYAAGALASYVIEGRLREVLGRRSMQRTIDHLEGHVILCGYGRLGRAVCGSLQGADLVVVDLDESIQREVEDAGHAFLHGSALEESVLRAAGVERARALIAATASDPDNVFIALSARELRHDLLIHARAETSAGVRRLALAGANQIVSPHQLAGRRIANALLRPGVVEFLELSDPGTGAEVDLEEVVLSSASRAEGIPLHRLHDLGIRVSVIAIKRGDESIRLHPRPDELLLGGDRVVAVGDRENLARLARVAHPEPAESG